MWEHLNKTSWKCDKTSNFNHGSRNYLSFPALLHSHVDESRTSMRDITPWSNEDNLDFLVLQNDAMSIGPTEVTDGGHWGLSGSDCVSQCKQILGQN